METTQQKKLHNFSLADFQKSYSNMVSVTLGNLLEDYNRHKAEHLKTYTIAEIEQINILNAAMLAMKRAIDGLVKTPEIALIDGNKSPLVGCETKTIVKGDATSQSIAAASILAKVARDRYMKKIDEEFPQYQFSKHKGYGTKLHYEMIEKYGICPYHRPSFLKKVLNK